jgi:hypothetical protein
MNVFASYLNKIKESLLSEEDLKDGICSTIKEKTACSLGKENISLRNGTICLEADPYLKTEIGLHKEDILTSLREKYPNKKLVDII